ncbi:MAG: polysulfide reductase NrfD [Acidobacteriota bacterium]|nr:MAG: polysulfide reductase NrfD [Acidobacteriota bacterium]
MSRERVLKRLKDLLWVLAISGAVIGVGRFVHGLAASTNMMDSLPWGWWKIFNMVAGAAVATSGFVIAAVIYIFRLDRYRAVARLAVLIGFLGYGASLTALIFDIGLPHRGWHPFFMWNPHSFLFEVFWCVSMYWGVTALELLPILSERFPFPKVTHYLHEIMLPFVVLGVTLSTMHHSSLGSLFLASPTRLHPLWHSIWIPPEFLISAMGAGVATMILVVLVLSWLYRWERLLPLLPRLAVVSAFFLGLYLVVKGVDFARHGKWNFVFGPHLTWESWVFWGEITLQTIIPLALFLTPQLRRRNSMLFVGSAAAFLGLVAHRLNTGIVGYFRTSEAIYYPNLSELILSFGVVAAAGLAFFFLIEKFPVLIGVGFGAPEEEHDAHDHVSEAPETGFYWTWDELRVLLTGRGARRVAMISLLTIPLTWAGLHEQATGAFQPIARRVEVAVTGSDVMRTTLVLNANRNDDAIIFPHEKHQKHFSEKFGLKKEDTCVKCHHLALPKDHNTVCRACHTDMHLPTPMFSPERHASRFEKPEQRARFEALDLDDRTENFEACMICHEETMRGLAAYEKRGFSHVAPGFVQAMHGTCMTCHRLEEKDPTDAFSLGNCLGCHRWTPPPEGQEVAQADEPDEPPEPRPFPIPGPVIIPKRGASSAPEASH